MSIIDKSYQITATYVDIMHPALDIFLLLDWVCNQDKLGDVRRQAVVIYDEGRLALQLKFW